MQCIIIHGTYADFAGRVLGPSADGERVRVEIELMGRPEVIALPGGFIAPAAGADEERGA